MNDTIKAKHGGYRVVEIRNILTGGAGAAAIWIMTVVLALACGY